MVLDLMLRLAAAFGDRRGAVTMDWVVLSAAIIALVFSVGASMTAELAEIAADLFGHASDGIEDMQ